MAAIDISSAGGGSVSTGVLQLQNGVAMDSTLRNVADQSNTTSPLKLSTSGVQVASTLQITTNNSTYLDIEDGSGNNRFTISRDPSSQQVNVDFASNPTGGSAIVGAIRTYVDDVNLSEIMQFREDGRIQIGSTSASAMYWDNTNNRLGIGTNAPISILDVRGNVFVQYSGSTDGYLQVGTNGGGIALACANRTDVSLKNNAIMTTRGTGITFRSTLGEPNGAILGVVGSGSTSATTSLLVQNSAGSQALKVDDSLRTTVQTLNILSTYPSLYIGSANMLDYGDGLRVGYDAAVTKVTLYTNAGTPQLQVNNSGQVSVGTTSPNASAKFQIDSTTLGFLPPRMTNAQRAAITTPAIGLMVYCTDVVEGIYVYKSTGWTFVA